MLLGNVHFKILLLCFKDYWALLLNENDLMPCNYSEAE